MSVNKTIFCLDLGTVTGWAVSENGTITSGSASWKTKRLEGAGMRYLRFSEWLVLMLGNLDIDVIYFEEVRRHAGTAAAHVYGGFMASLMAFCEKRDIPYSSVPVGTIKKHATGKGNAGKPQMIAAMEAKGHTITDDNQADALALLYYVMEELRC